MLWKDTLDVQLRVLVRYAISARIYVCHKITSMYINMENVEQRLADAVENG